MTVGEEMTKICNRCHVSLPLTSFYRKTPTRLSTFCKNCTTEKCKEKYRREHPKKEQAPANFKSCCKCGQVLPCDAFDKRSDKPHLCHSYCKECGLKLRMERYYSDPEFKKKIIRNAIEYAKTPRGKERKKLSIARNKEKVNERARKWRAANREKIRARIKKYVIARKQVDSLFLLRCRIQTLIGEHLRAKGYTKKSRCEAMLGCSYQELMERLGPRPGEDWHLDHIVPCACARTEEELMLLQHWSNLRWLPKEENLRKGNRKTPEGVILHVQLLSREWI